MIKKSLRVFKKLTVVITSLAVVSSFGFSTAAVASGTANSATSTTTSVVPDKLSDIISRGDSEITRRIKTLNKLDALINASIKISASDKTTLTTEVNNEISGLTADKTSLDAATTLTAAHTAAQAIFTEYRVYLLVVPQVKLIRAADRQQQIEASLTTLANNITTELGSSITSTESSDLSSMKTDISNASSLSSSVETAVLALTPANFNNNHAVLVQYNKQLNTAASDIQQAISEAKTLVNLAGK